MPVPPTAPAGAASQPAPAGAASQPVPALVTTGWLDAHRSDAGVVVLQVDEEAAGTHARHVVGAVPVDWLDDLHHPVRRGYLDATGLADLLGRLGVTATTHVVLLGDADNTFAASAFWLLRHHGHRALSLVDGGTRAWRLEGRPEDDEAPVPRPAHYPVPEPDPSVRARRDDILGRFVGAAAGTVLLDCRSPAEYEGRDARGVDLPVQQHRVPGHVPGARNLDASHLLDAGTGRFLPLRRMREVFASRGAVDHVEVALYCRLAERSSLLWFVLHELLGHPRSRNYDGGWAEYGSLVDAPVEH